VALEILQMLWCIVYKSKKVASNFLSQNVIRLMGLLPWRFILIMFIPNCLLKENHNL
jgi:hypothetical protein